MDNTLREKMLDAPLIIHGFVDNEPECNYERYLTELINHSTVLMTKSKGKVFKWENRQDHGECDAISDNYSIDYKLLATKSSLQCSRETSGSITKQGDGFYAFGCARWPEGKEFTYIRLVAALRKYSEDDLRRIAINPINKIEREISIVLKSLRVRKNLLLFYPYTMSFSEPHSFKDACNSITEAFNEDLQGLNTYRKREVSDCDTFLSLVYDEKLLIYTASSGLWRLDDFVELSNSKIYMDLYYRYGNNGFNY